jgi:DNA-binding MarR family transcriptional regulator
MHQHCLYFTAGGLAREMSRLAEGCFAPVGVNPTQGLALLCIDDEPGIRPSVIAERLGLAASTITRVVDALETRGFVESRSQGRLQSLCATAAGAATAGRVTEAWKALHERYAAALGREFADDLCARIRLANEKLGGGGPDLRDMASRHGGGAE